jgi:hypothetical protein
MADYTRSLIYIIVVIMLSVIASAAIPDQLSIPLRYSDANGVFTGSKQFTFKIYDVTSGGSSLFSQTSTITFDEGIGNVILFDTGIKYNTSYWLGITKTGGVEMTPRLNITRAAYAASVNWSGVQNSNASAVGTCGEGLYVQNMTSAGPQCAAAAGAGDITGVYGDNVYIYNGSGNGEVTLVLNQTMFNKTVDARFTSDNVTAWGFYKNIANVTGVLSDGKDCFYDGTNGKINCTRTITDYTNGGTITGNLVVNGNLTVIGATFNATVLNAIVNGSFLPSMDNQFDLGGAVTRWRTTYAVTSNASTYCLGATCIAGWNEINGSVFSGITLNGVTVASWAEVNKTFSDTGINDQTLNITGNVTFRNLTITRNLSAQNITSLSYCAAGTCINSWAEVNGSTTQETNLHDQALNTTSDVIFRNLSATGNFTLGGIGAQVLGTVTSPALLLGDVDTGIYRPNYNTIGFSTAGVQAAYLTSSGVYTPNINVSGSSNASVFCLDSVCVDTWAEVNVTASSVSDVWVNTTGDTMTGSLLVNNFSSIDTTSLETTILVPPDLSMINQVPFALQFHDLLAFNSAFTTNYAIYDGTNWVNTTLDASLFSQKEDIIVNVMNNVTNNASRWTWSQGYSAVSYSSAYWLGISYAYKGAPSNVVYATIESSPDGITWTTRHNSVYSISTTGTYYHYMPYGYSGDAYLRLTLNKTSGYTDLAIASIKLLTARMGNQGRGSEYEYPYTWDASKNIGFTGNVTMSGNLSVGNLSALRISPTSILLGSTAIATWSEINNITSGNVTGWGFYNNVTNFTGTNTVGGYCVYNGSRIECNATASSTPQYDLHNQVAGLNLTSNVTFRNITVTNLLALGTIKIASWDEVNKTGVFGITADNISGWGFKQYDNVLNMTGNVTFENLTITNALAIGSVKLSSWSELANLTSQNVTAWGFYNSVSNSSFVINSNNITGWGYYNNITNFTGTNTIGGFCVYNGSRIECNATASSTSQFDLHNQVAGLNLTSNVTFRNLTITNNLSSQNISSLSYCIGGICITSWGEINITSVTGASGGISSANISGYGFQQFDQNVNTTGNVTFRNLTVSRNLSVANISVGATGYVWLNGVGILTWDEVNKTISGASGGITADNVSGWGFKQFDNVLNFTGNVTFENLSVMRNLSAGNITVNGSGYLSLGGLRLLSWAEINWTSFSQLTTGNATSVQMAVSGNVTANIVSALNNMYVWNNLSVLGDISSDELITRNITVTGTLSSSILNGAINATTGGVLAGNYTVTQNLSATGNLTGAGLYISNSGYILGNTTCTFMYSPSKTTRIEVCD